MFLHLSVSHSVHRGEYLGRYHPPGRYTPLGRYTPRQVPPRAGTTLGRYTPPAGTPQAGTPLGSAWWDTVNKLTVRSLLECILVAETLMCPPGYFACRSGLCILERDRCNGYTDCKDMSDESRDWAECTHDGQLQYTQPSRSFLIFSPKKCPDFKSSSWMSSKY